ncbi:hypothetical protein HPB47_026142 [Ixodes persulcatus]|uniref:Uncharacterized protein n=1 Tax=Ixodes persulcatus TaxID=34615 RepID=A0AC60Q1K0_IXOPE|nr:hypothetical protein HPB47_026142 [Ixodes persulcatus]
MPKAQPPHHRQRDGRLMSSGLHAGSVHDRSPPVQTLCHRPADRHTQAICGEANGAADSPTRRITWWRVCLALVSVAEGKGDTGSRVPRGPCTPAGGTSGAARGVCPD